MARRTRLDTELVRRGLARSREQAGDLIAAGRVAVAGLTAGRPATQVGQDAAITVENAGPGADYASRGGRKLEGALAAFPALVVAGRRCLDAGASTGGFTDVLLRAGAAQVVAVDVGYGQLAWALRGDPRVTVLDRVNVRQLTPEQVVPAAALEVGLGVQGIVASPLPGPSGNVEYFLWLRRAAPPLDHAALQRAITEVPR